MPEGWESEVAQLLDIELRLHRELGAARDAAHRDAIAKRVRDLSQRLDVLCGMDARASRTDPLSLGE